MKILPQINNGYSVRTSLPSFQQQIAMPFSLHSCQCEMCKKNTSHWFSSYSLITNWTVFDCLMDLTFSFIWIPVDTHFLDIEYSSHSLRYSLSFSLYLERFSLHRSFRFWCISIPLWFEFLEYYFKTFLEPKVVIYFNIFSFESVGVLLFKIYVFNTLGLYFCG